MKKGTCPYCLTEVNKESLQPEFDADGLPLAFSCTEGLGLPFWRRFNEPLKVLLNGQEVSRIVAVDRTSGFLWQIKTDSNGKLIHDGHKFAMERLEGIVTFEAMA